MSDYSNAFGGVSSCPPAYVSQNAHSYSSFGKEATGNSALNYASAPPTFVLESSNASAQPRLEDSQRFAMCRIPVAPPSVSMTQNAPTIDQMSQEPKDKKRIKMDKHNQSTSSLQITLAIMIKI